METSGSNRGSKVASGDDAVISSPGPEEAAVAGTGQEVAVSPPAPAASPKPYYECVFCKRGFTTAQALGGHMNIHRGDRAKRTRESPAGGMTTVSRNVECYHRYRHLSYPSTTSTPMPIGSSSSSNFVMYCPSPGIAAAVETESISPSSMSPRELSLFGAATSDQDLHLGLVCHGDAGDEPRMPPEGSERQEGDPERELDLELRLGRRPRH